MKSAKDIYKEHVKKHPTFDVGQMNKDFDDYYPVVKAGGIASYPASPLDLRRGYDDKVGEKFSHEISYYIKGNICEPLIDYAEYLEQMILNFRAR